MHYVVADADGAVPDAGDVGGGVCFLGAFIKINMITKLDRKSVV